MNSKKVFWANPHSDGGWAVQESRYGGTLFRYSSQSKAWIAARRLACGTQSDAILQDKHKRIVTKNTYSNDLTEDE